MPVDRVITQFVQQGVSGLRSDLRAIQGDMQNTESRIERLSDRLLGLGAAGAAGLATLGYASLKAHGEIQMAEIGFSKTLGSMAAAKAKIQELRQFDRESPFSFRESVKGAMRLSAVGFEANQLKDVLRDIGDAAAGSGGGTDDFMGIARAIGQMKGKGKISMEEINQLGDRGINALELLQRQLKFTDEQKAKLMQGEWTIESDVGVDALLKGFRELYGGAMLEASKTFPGQVSNLQSAVFQLADAMGEVISKGDGIGSLIEKVTGFTDSTAEFVKNNPELVKTGLALAGIATVSTLVAAGGLKVLDVWKGVGGLFGSVAKSKDLLTKATKADTAAEAAKTIVAGKESAAILGAGKASDYSATAAMRLAGANAEAAMAADDVAKAAARQGGKLGVLARAQMLLNRSRSLLSMPLGGAAMSTVPALATSHFRHLKGTPEGGRIFSNKTWNAGKMSAARHGLYTSGGLQMVGGAPVTMGGAAMGGLAGVGAGISASNNMKAAGYSDGQSYMYGAATGIGAAGAAMFLPGGAVAVAIAEGAAFGINKLFNEPMEREAERGDFGARQAAERAKSDFAGKSDFEQAQQMLKEANELQAKADEIQPNAAVDWLKSGDYYGKSGKTRKEDLEAEAMSRRLSARALMNQQRRADRAASEKARVNQDEFAARAVNRKGSTVDDWANYEQHTRHNGEIVIRNRPADHAQRNRRRQSITPQRRVA